MMHPSSYCKKEKKAAHNKFRHESGRKGRGNGVLPSPSCDPAMLAISRCCLAYSPHRELLVLPAQFHIGLVELGEVTSMLFTCGQNRMKEKRWETWKRDEYRSRERVGVREQEERERVEGSRIRFNGENSYFLSVSDQGFVLETLQWQLHLTYKTPQDSITAYNGKSGFIAITVSLPYCPFPLLLRIIHT